MLVALVRGVARGRPLIESSDAAALLLDKGVGNEVVDDGGVDGRI